jgi:hypothetical protein
MSAFWRPPCIRQINKPFWKKLVTEPLVNHEGHSCDPDVPIAGNRDRKIPFDRSLTLPNGTSMRYDRAALAADLTLAPPRPGEADISIVRPMRRALYREAWRLLEAAAD